MTLTFKDLEIMWFCKKRRMIMVNIWASLLYLRLCYGPDSGYDGRTDGRTKPISVSFFCFSKRRGTIITTHMQMQVCILWKVLSLVDLILLVFLSIIVCHRSEYAIIQSYSFYLSVFFTSFICLFIYQLYFDAFFKHLLFPFIFRLRPLWLNESSLFG